LLIPENKIVKKNPELFPRGFIIEWNRRVERKKRTAFKRLVDGTCISLILHAVALTFQFQKNAGFFLF
jgi:hypothetical protein